MPDEIYVATASELPPGTIKGAGRYAVGNADGKRFAVTRRCRHLREPGDDVFVPFSAI
jgi:hypothetical protein